MKLKSTFFNNFFSRLLSINCLLILGFLSFSYAQEIPLGACGVVFTYDLSGNQLSRQYICNNVPLEAVATRSSVKSTDSENASNLAIVKAKVIYPNPTTGILHIKLFSALEKGVVSVLNLSGNVVWQKSEQGDHLVLDLSSLQKGNYVLRIVDEVTQTRITQNIIKL